MINVTVRTFDADYNEILDTRSLMEKIQAFDAYQSANPKTAEELADDELADQMANNVLNRKTVENLD